MTITHHPELIQGSDEWFAARCGLLTAGSMNLILTPKTLKSADNDKSRSHLYELLAQRVTKYVEPSYVSDDMLRGLNDEVDAKILYAEKYHPVQDVGFITNDQWGFEIGFSPDGLVGDDGMIECKSRMQKYQAQTIIYGGVPDDYMLQIQTGMMVAARQWCDFISYCGGMPMYVYRVSPDPLIVAAITDAAIRFEAKLADSLRDYQTKIKNLYPTERKIYEDIVA